MTKVPPARLVDTLIAFMLAESIHDVFSVPGGLIHPFLSAVDKHPALKLIVSKHEQGAVFAADGFARTHGRLAICAATSGPGATNMLTAAAVAFTDGIPLLLITGQAPSYLRGKGAAQETTTHGVDVNAMFAATTKFSTTVTAPERFADDFNRAMRFALTGRQGPVHLSVPVDFWNALVPANQLHPLHQIPKSSTFDPHAVEQAAHALLHARYPLLLAGAGILRSRAAPQLKALAELLQARVVTSPSAKGVFPENHPLSLGVVGFGSHDRARETLLGNQVDVLFAVGASMSEMSTFQWDPALLPNDKFIHLNIDPELIGRNFPADIPLLGDARAILHALLARLTARDAPPPASLWKNEPALTNERYRWPELRASSSSPITPQRWRAELSEVLADDAIVYSDIGGHMLFNLHDLEIRENQDFVLNLNFGSMGHGTAAPIGAALAAPERPVIAIIGDACFMMNGMELLTAVEYDIPVLWIVENNQMHGISWYGSQIVDPGQPMQSVSYKKPVAIGRIARAMGLEAYIIEHPGQLQNAVKTALSRKTPSLIEIRVDHTISPPVADRARSIARSPA